jgi:hypothetical protein
MQIVKLVFYFRTNTSVADKILISRGFIIWKFNINVSLLRVLTMVYNTQNYWVFGLCPSSGILETRKHNVSETGSVSVLR